MHVPSQSWGRGSWNLKLSQFNSLGRMVGLGPNPSTGELDAVIKKVSSAKVFAESIEAFLKETARRKGWELERARKWVLEELEHINKKLGLMEPLPFMSMNDGFVDPASFSGVAIWPAGVINWMVLRHEQILQQAIAGAKFKRVVVLWSSRECKSAADLRHPYGKGDFEGEYFTEWGIMHDIVGWHGSDELEYEEPNGLPKRGEILSLEQQLQFLKDTGQYDELIGDEDIYVPSTPNSLYVPMHVRRVLGKDNVFFSQAGARLVPKQPDFFSPVLQDIMTTPNGIFRLWKELREAACITD